MTTKGIVCPTQIRVVGYSRSENLIKQGISDARPNDALHHYLVTKVVGADWVSKV